jgi:hypothetical protein
VRALAGLGDTGEVGGDGVAEVRVGGLAGAGAHGTLLKESEPGAEDVAEDGADEAHAGSGVEIERVEFG